MKSSLRIATRAPMLACPFASAQSAPQDWEADIRTVDASDWDASNACEAFT